MKITLLIDTLGPGGAQRQICMLAGMLKKSGNEVTLLKYHENDFFLPLLTAVRVPVESILRKNRLRRLFAIRRRIRALNPDVVVSFLFGPNLVAELSGFPKRRFGLVVSERWLDSTESVSASAMARLHLHRFADVVVANSHAQTKFITSTAPWLRGKAETVINCVDLEYFDPTWDVSDAESNGVRILVLGRLDANKNALGLVEAMRQVRKKAREQKISVDWYGSDVLLVGKGSSSYSAKVRQAVSRYSLEDIFRIHEPIEDVKSLYRKATVLCLPSLSEGFPNTVCEGMACGKAILASDIGDNRRLIQPGQNGFLFDPRSPMDIGNAILRFAALSNEDRRALQIRSREIAEQLLSPSVFERRYLSLIEKTANGRYGTRRKKSVEQR